jgi:hypothetical protein
MCFDFEANKLRQTKFYQVNKGEYFSTAGISLHPRAKLAGQNPGSVAGLS